MSGRLESIEERLAAATPAPWTAETNFSAVSIRHPDAAARMGWRAVAQVPGYSPVAEANADLIVHAPADLTALVKLARAVQAARPDLNHHHAHMVPGRWDKDGSRCDVCARVSAMDAALAELEQP